MIRSVMSVKLTLPRLSCIRNARSGGQAPFVLTVTREDGQLFVRGTGQPKGAVYAKSADEFFSKLVDAQFTFETDAQGKVTALVQHQGGRDLRAPRIDEGTARQLEDTAAQRFKDQKPTPGAEAMIRREIDELRGREPSLDETLPSSPRSRGRKCPTPKTRSPAWERYSP
jgi:hypothetical protein